MFSSSRSNRKRNCEALSGTGPEKKGKVTSLSAQSDLTNGRKRKAPQNQNGASQTVVKKLNTGSISIDTDEKEASLPESKSAVSQLMGLISVDTVEKKTPLPEPKLAVSQLRVATENLPKADIAPDNESPNTKALRCLLDGLTVDDETPEEPELIELTRSVDVFGHKDISEKTMAIDAEHKDDTVKRRLRSESPPVFSTSDDSSTTSLSESLLSRLDHGANVSRLKETEQSFKFHSSSTPVTASTSSVSSVAPTASFDSEMRDSISLEFDSPFSFQRPLDDMEEGSDSPVRKGNTEQRTANFELQEEPIAMPDSPRASEEESFLSFPSSGSMSVSGVTAPISRAHVSESTMDVKAGENLAAKYQHTTHSMVARLLSDSFSVSDESHPQLGSPRFGSLNIPVHLQSSLVDDVHANPHAADILSDSTCSILFSNPENTKHQAPHNALSVDTREISEDGSTIVMNEQDQVSPRSRY